MRRLIPSLVCASLLVQGCTPWPRPGAGGMAENYQHTLMPIETDYPVTSLQALRMDFDHSQRHLDILLLQGARECFPAAVKDAESRQNRIARELVGGLHHDASIDLIAQRAALHELAQKLAPLQPLRHCRLESLVDDSGEVRQDFSAPRYTSKVAEILDEGLLSRLLNSDNQFAADSDRVNPKYAANLREAAQILKNHPGIQLIITGHTDSHGAAGYNENLALRRAHQVSSLLQRNGIAANRIQVSQQGEAAPQFPGQAVEIDLVNRRVWIDLVNSGVGS